ncbi:YicC/YloC family endoribonuclease [Alicyclobacillus herbarius]|uniref:YicC/YloC family endoribonuclease n=1 Tax=Alicyclobacillus herbarius TaxID=122960 RepID=UPI0006854EC4|nr:YicC/YloC family endoribonuclease [Alicyclobacillus herbarius]
MDCRSMTGFGQAVVTAGTIQLSAEVRTVNHRFCDVVVHLPKHLRALEDELRHLVTRHIRRGRAEVTVTLSQELKDPEEVINWPLLERLWSLEGALMERMRTLGRTEVRPAQPFEWLTFPGVVHSPETRLQIEDVRVHVMEAVERACQDVVAMRQREGTRICDDLQGKLRELEGFIRDMRQRAPQRLQIERQRLEARLKEWTGAVHPDRLAAELALYADKVSIDEELARLASHLHEFSASLAAGSPIGRRLDFIVQELHREVNTIGAKAADAEISKSVVDAKTIIEQLREQVQNIE